MSETELTSAVDGAASPSSGTQARRRGAGWVRCGLVWRALVWLVQLLGFIAQVVDELVTAWLGIAPVLPRLRRWCQQLVSEWRVYRAVTAGEVIEGEVMDGVWR